MDTWFDTWFNADAGIRKGGMSRLRPFSTLLLLLMGLALFSGCADGDDATTGGRIVLWHNDDPTTGAALDSLVERFMEINPQIIVSVVAVPQDEMLARYRDSAGLSLGPDLFIGSSRWIQPLADEGLIQSLEPYAPSLEQFLSTAVENVTYDRQIYGLPYGLKPNALYYNGDLVETPPSTLTDLLAQAAEGRGAAMTTSFDHSLWGLRAFGGRLFDELGRLALDQGGFASWLTWMDTAQNATGMFLNNDRTTLLNLFTSERVAYFVGTPDDLPELRAAMGENADIRVAQLPAGPGGTAGPLLHVDALLFNAASAPRNTRAALSLARFLTNDENSLRLAREIGHIPANLRVPGIDARTYPIVNGFMTQARTALPISNTDAMTAILSEGDRLYRQVLDGVVGAAVSATTFTETINASLGFAAMQTESVERCTVNGEVRLWHSWQSRDRTALQSLIEAFQAECPAARVVTTRFNSPDEMLTTYRVLADSNLRPDVLLLPDTSVYALASEGLIQPVAGTSLEQFIPAALNALTYANQVYGVPLSVSLSVLYYNRTQVVDAPRTLDDLLTEVNEGRGIALTPTFEQSFWGIPAFGGSLFTPELALNVEQNGAMTAWLTWLREADELPGFVIETDVQQSVDAFGAGELAYFIGSSQRLPDFIELLGENAIALTGLPAGPLGDASPILRADAFFFSDQLDASQLAVARTFVDFMTSISGQTQLFVLTQRFPANVNVEPEDSLDQNSALATVRQQVARATVYPNIMQIPMLLDLGTQAYRDVLSGAAEPADAVAQFTAQIDEITRAAAEATPEITPETTPETPMATPEAPTTAPPSPQGATE